MMSNDQDNPITIYPTDPGTIIHISGSMNHNGQWIVAFPPGPVTFIPFSADGDLCGGNAGQFVKPIIIKQQKVSRGNCDGYSCVTCNDFYPMAELNSPKGVEEFTSFACYECRNKLK